ncbi:ORF6N domain-containing protein [Yokenella regensburgei]|uniref:ORF6N domain-containing protein n=1 Tax=Yokenella regensburgei TaxID=158877 RepID=UPI003EDAE15A
MTNQISAETISPIAYQNLPVITTELLAQLYGTEAVRIQQNHKRNDGRFVEGKHFFKVVGESLKNLRLSLSESQNPVSPKTRSLILWTERGAARHAKMLETDQAWEVFEKLEDCYFSQKEKAPAPARPSHRHNAPTFRYIITLTYKDVVTGQEETFRGGANSPGEIIQGTAKRFGIFVSEMISMPVGAYY